MARDGGPHARTNSFDSLDAPVRRVAAMDVFVAYHPDLENAILPQTADLFQAMKELSEY